MRFGCQLQNFLQEATLKDEFVLTLLMSFSDDSLLCRGVSLAQFSSGCVQWESMPVVMKTTR